MRIIKGNELHCVIYYVNCFIKFVMDATSVCDDRVKYVDEYVRLGPKLVYSRRDCRIRPKYKHVFHVLKSRRLHP